MLYGEISVYSFTTTSARFTYLIQRRCVIIYPYVYERIIHHNWFVLNVLDMNRAAIDHHREYSNGIAFVDIRKHIDPDDRAADDYLTMAVVKIGKIPIRRTLATVTKPSR